MGRLREYTGKWDQLLIQNANILQQQELLQTLKTNKDIYICSDRGAKNTVGSYGAVVATDKKILLKLTRQAYRNTPRSFRAEAYGMLAILRILQHTIIYYQLETKSKKRIYSDNKGLIERINQIQHKKIIPPQRCMLSESDIELQIWETLQTLNTDSILQHVLGHQDQGEKT